MNEKIIVDRIIDAMLMKHRYSSIIEHIAGGALVETDVQNVGLSHNDRVETDGVQDKLDLLKDKDKKLRFLHDPASEYTMKVRE